MPERPWTDEYTLLCEKCGYVIEGLDTEGHCPECGKPIGESLPERRVGTPWQQAPGVRSLLSTWWMTLRHPLRTLDVMRVQDVQLFSTLFMPLLLISLFFVLIGSIQILVFGEIPQLGVLVFTFYSGFAGLVSGLIVGLTSIESFGLRVIGRQRNYRTSKSLTNSIVVHGAVGWFWLVAGLGIFWNVYLALGAFGTSGLTVTDRLLEHLWLSLFLFLTMSLLIGFLFFETFAYLGLRRLKYANRVRPDDA